MDVWTPPTFPTPGSGALFVCAATGSDTNPGTIAKPFATIAAAVAAAAGKPGSTVVLRTGTYHSGMVVVTPDHQGLTIQNHNGEHAVVSGGVPIAASKSAWKPYHVAPPVSPATAATATLPAGWTEVDNANNVYGRAVSKSNSSGLVYLGSFSELDGCVAAMVGSNGTSGPFHSLTWHSKQFKHGSSPFDRQCFGRTDLTWSPRTESGIVSVKGPGVVPTPSPPGPGPRPPPPPPPPPNIWVLDLSELPAGKSLDTVLGLRLNGGRAIRAKYPNGNPELSGPDAVDVLTYRAGWVTEETDWVTPADKWNETEDDVTNAAGWPGVNWPMAEEKTPGMNVTPASGGGQSGEGDWGDFHIGHGGFCDDLCVSFDGLNPQESLSEIHTP